MLKTVPLRRGLLAMGIIFAAFSLGLLSFSKGFHSPLAWLPTGLAAALLVRWGRPIWPWVAAGALLVGAIVRGPPFGTVFGAFAVLSGPWVLSWTLERLGFRPDFSRRIDVLKFVFATPLAMVVPPTLTLLAIYRVGAPGDVLQRPLGHWLEWWLNGTIAVMLIGPAIIAARRGMLQRWLQERYAALALLLATAVFCVTMLTMPLSIRSSWLSPVGVLIIVVSAMRMDLTFTGLLTLAMTTAVALTAQGAAPGAAYVGPGVARVWAFCMVLAGLTLILRALLAEREALDQRLREAEARYRHGLLEAAAREQERIGRDVHDALGQELTAISLLARSLESRARDRAPELREDAEEVVRTCWRAVQSARTIARGLVPSIERNEDLVRALQALAERLALAGGELQIEVAAAPGLKIPPESARNLYRIAQEALNNVLKHSRARRVQIRLAPCELGAGRHGVRLSIEDDGVGIAAQATGSASPGLGQRTMQYRAEVAGGETRFESGPGRGTRVVCELPLPADAPPPGAAATGRPDAAADLAAMAGPLEAASDSRAA